jgi:hypothetical protein
LEEQVEEQRPWRIDRRIAGQLIEVGPWTLDPVVRVTGYAGAGGEEQGAGGGAWLKVTPVEVVVRQPGQDDTPIPISPSTPALLRSLLVLSGVVAAVALAILTLVKR